MLRTPVPAFALLEAGAVVDLATGWRGWRNRVVAVTAIAVAMASMTTIVVAMIMVNGWHTTLGSETGACWELSRRQG